MRRRVTVVLMAVLLAGSARAAERSDSLQALPLHLIDQHGHPVALRDLQGHPVIISMFYGSCPMACPLLISHIRGIEARLDARTRADLRVLLVSFDPGNDTPQALAAIAQSRGLDDGRWTLATTSEAEVRVLAAVLGIKYRKLPEGGFNHTSVIALLDRDGRIDHRYEGSDIPADEAGARLRQLAQ